MSTVTVSDDEAALLRIIRAMVSNMVHEEIRNRPAPAPKPAPPPPPPAIPDKLERLVYSMGEVAELLGVSRATLWRWRKDKKFKTVRIGSRPAVPHAELMRLAQGSD